MNYKFLLLIVLCFSLISIKLNSQNLLIETTDGELITEQLDSVQKLSFPDDKLLFSMRDNTTNSYSLTSIRKLYFDLSVGFDENEMSTMKNIPGIFPNPVFNYIEITNLTKNLTDVFIFSIQGDRLRHTQVSSRHNRIDVADLGKGIYFLRINNQTLKFIKL